MSYKNSGFKKEDDFVEALNNKKVCEINQNLKFTLSKIFGNLDENEIIKCELIKNFVKPDFYITYKNITKNVSLKTGRTVVVHEEYLSTLIPFLKSIGLSEKSASFFAKYCYGDDSTDGNGVVEYSYLEMKMRYDKDIKSFNNEVMSNKDFIKKAIKRFLFKGSKEENIEADYIYFGTINYGVLCSQQQIFRHLDRRDWAFMENPHIGPLQFKSHYREHSNDPYKEKRRHQCDIWWANLGADMEYISERYDG